MTDSPPTTILHCLEAVRFEEGGVVRSVVDLCKVLAEQGADVTLATWDTQDVPPDWGAGGATPRVIDALGDPAAFRAALDATDVAHLHTPWAVRNLGIARRLRSRGIPYVISSHGMLDDWSMAQRPLKKRVYLRVAGRRMLQRAYRVHCTAEGERREASRWFPHGTPVVLPLIVDLPSPDRLPGPGAARAAFPPLEQPLPAVLYLGRLHPQKGVDRLVRAAGLARQQGVGVQLLLAGAGAEGYVEQLKQIAAEGGVANQTHFTGLVLDDLKWSLYQACDLFVLPTFQESFGLVLPEALACGTPVVTNRAVDTWPEIEAAGGVIIENTPEQIAAQLVSLLADPAALAERGRQGQAYVAQWLDKRRVADEYLQLYRQAAASRGDARRG